MYFTANCPTLGFTDVPLMIPNDDVPNVEFGFENVRGQCVEKLRTANLQARTFFQSGKHQRTHHSQVYVELTWSIHDSRTAISEVRSNAIGPDDGRFAETGSIEVIPKIIFDSARINNI